jgi:hypothetical protein
MLPSFNPEQLVHVHLLLNHFPTVGFGVGVGLLLVSIFQKGDDLKRASLVILLIIALLALPAYMSGKSAQDALTGRPDVSEALIEGHQDAALLAFVFMEITGGLAWLGLWQFRQISRQQKWNLTAIVIVSLVTFVLMARAANIGGNIRHPEITTSDAGSNTEWLKSESIAALINNTEWAWAAMETIHFVGLSLLFGSVLVVSLRMLGAIKMVSFSAVHKFLPWGMLGFGLNLITGILFFVAVPSNYTKNIAMQWKMGIMMIAGVNILYYSVFGEAWSLKAGDDATLAGKVVAASTIILWVAVIYFGRMLPFIGNR